MGETETEGWTSRRDNPLVLTGTLVTLRAEKGGGVWKGTDVTERAPQIRNSGAERDTG